MRYLNIIPIPGMPGIQYPRDRLENGKTNSRRRLNGHGYCGNVAGYSAVSNDGTNNPIDIAKVEERK